MGKGFVALVGAGAGSKDLLTIRGKQLIEEAEVVVYDRLVFPDILDLAPTTAEFINVGKQSGNHLVAQEEINKILLEKAQEGHKVVRLKGGDPFVFGRGGEELELLSKNQIDFEVVPGITSSIAAASFAGIPVTHRDFCSSFHIITGHKKNDEKLDINFKALVETKGTLVFLMGVKALKDIVDGLVSAGMSTEMPVAVVQNGARASQKKVIGTLSDIADISVRENIQSPAVIIVGKVCTLSNEFDWFSTRALFGKKVVVTRPLGSDSTLEEKLSRLGADVLSLPCVEIQKLDFEEELKQSLKDLNSYNYLVFTSKNGVKEFFSFLHKNSLDARTLNKVKVAAVGKPTKNALLEYGIMADLTPETYDSLNLAKEIIKNSEKGQKILLLRAKNGSADLPKTLEESGLLVKDLALYKTVPYLRNKGEIKSLLEKEKVIVCFTSASAVEGFSACIEEKVKENILAVCIGNQTALQAKNHGINFVVSEKATLNSVAEKVLEVAENV